MTLPDLLHCPHCKGRFSTPSVDLLSCSGCARTVRLLDGIADFTGAAQADAAHDGAERASRQADAVDLYRRIKPAAGADWPTSLGDVIAFDGGGNETADAFLKGQYWRSLLLLSPEIEVLRACRAGIASVEPEPGRPVACATFDATRNVIRDAVADTFFGAGQLARIGDVRGFLTMVHRVLKPNGRAAFVVPNRRYHEAMCLAMAEALVQGRVGNSAWPQGQEVALEIVARIRRLVIHRGDTGFLAGLRDKHLFDSEALEDLGREVGFGQARTIPLEPDLSGEETIRRSCRLAGAPLPFTEPFASLAGAVGRPFFNLLGRQDGSASMLLWLTKGPGPEVRIFQHRQPPPPADVGGPNAALGGAAPRWSVELSAEDTPDGVRVSLGGWCLCNTDVRWLRLTLDGVTRDAPVWRPRPDVHDVLNRHRLYHALNALCSGLTGALLFNGAHPKDGVCGLRLEVILASGLVVTGPAPEMLTMGDKMVIAH